jgi:hypothetical protein
MFQQAESPSILLSIRKYAARRDCTIGAVQMALRRGQITRNADGLIDAVEADSLWPDKRAGRNGLPGGRSRGKRPARPGPTATASPSSAVQPGGNGGPTPGLFEYPPCIESDEKIKYWKGVQEELAAKQLQGDLLPRAEVSTAAYECARRARDIMLALRDRLSPILASETDVDVIRGLLGKEILQACSEIGTATEATEATEATA